VISRISREEMAEKASTARLPTQAEHHQNAPWCVAFGCGDVLELRELMSFRQVEYDSWFVAPLT
jgi:hypothetical protein